MQPTLLDIFSRIDDPRRAEGKMYPLGHVLLFSLLATLSGATSYRKMPQGAGVKRSARKVCAAERKHPVASWDNRPVRDDIVAISSSRWLKCWSVGVIDDRVACQPNKIG
jgi:hypothetical protein